MGLPASVGAKMAAAATTRLLWAEAWGLWHSTHVTISIAAVIGGSIMVLTGCLNMEQAYRSIDWRAIFLIAGMLPLGTALERTGAASLLAKGVVVGEKRIRGGIVQRVAEGLPSGGSSAQIGGPSDVAVLADGSLYVIINLGGDHVVELNYIIDQIAEILGITEGASKSQLHRARGRMRELLKPYLGSGHLS